jgi:hypothetical protein
MWRPGRASRPILSSHARLGWLPTARAVSSVTLIIARLVSRPRRGALGKRVGLDTATRMLEGGDGRT